VRHATNGWVAMLLLEIEAAHPRAVPGSGQHGHVAESGMVIGVPVTRDSRRIVVRQTHDDVDRFIGRTLGVEASHVIEQATQGTNGGSRIARGSVHRNRVASREDPYPPNVREAQE